MKRVAQMMAVVALGLPLGSGVTISADDSTEVRQIEAVLDDFHAAASEADGERYFSHLAPAAVFLGTDASERWTKEQFRAFAEPYFSQGKGWTYQPRDRHVSVADGGRTAWFDEALDSASYGECRGSGVLRKHGEAWKIEQYNLSIPMPNSLAKEFVAKIREHGRTTSDKED